MVDAVNTGWALHPQLVADTCTVGDFPLCRLLLAHDARYPWTILVPRRAGIRELHELGDDDQAQLLLESNRLARALVALFAPDKLNIAALGNVVPQLHLHHIARRHDDDAWPAPVWGRHPALAYENGAQAERRHALIAQIGPELIAA